MAFLQQQFLMSSSASSSSTRTTPSSSSSSSQTPPPTPPSPLSTSEFTSPRALRQLGLFAGGASFFLLSTAITRRSLVRRYKATVPKFYTPSNRANYDINGAMEAFEALNIATINVASVAMMATGGLLWAFDISSLDDIRRRVRMNVGIHAVGSAGDENGEAERQIEEWFAEVLDRKEFRALRGEKGIKDLEKGKGEGEKKE